MAADKIIVDCVSQISQKRGISQAQTSLAWLLSKPAVTAPIVGATKIQHLEDAISAVSISLTEDEIHNLEEPYIPHSVVGFR
jgi:1-deoxyxylulose-5-phosphate synthase